jgi:hypothetical protein
MSCRDIALEGLRLLESRGLCQTIGGLRCLRGLLTPQARATVAQAMLGDIRNQGDLEAVCKGAVKEMLVAFHWREGNPKMDVEKGVSPLCLLTPPFACVEVRGMRVWNDFAGGHCAFESCSVCSAGQHREGGLRPGGDHQRADHQLGGVVLEQ